MYLLSSSFEMEVYIYMGIYMEVFSLQPRAQMFISADIFGGWAEMEFLCRYANNETCSPISYVIYERTYVCHRVCC